MKSLHFIRLQRRLKANVGFREHFERSEPNSLLRTPSLVEDRDVGGKLGVSNQSGYKSALQSCECFVSLRFYSLESRLPPALPLSEVLSASSLPGSRPVP